MQRPTPPWPGADALVSLQEQTEQDLERVQRELAEIRVLIKQVEGEVGEHQAPAPDSLAQERSGKPAGDGAAAANPAIPLQGHGGDPRWPRQLPDCCLVGGSTGSVAVQLI